MDEIEAPRRWFVALDGDKVGARLEALIVSEALEDVGRFSLRISSAVQAVSERIQKLHGQVIFAGGDSVLATFDSQASIEMRVLELGNELQEIFVGHAGCSASVGIGTSARCAYLALKVAKGGVSGRLVLMHE